MTVDTILIADRLLVNLRIIFVSNYANVIPQSIFSNIGSKNVTKKFANSDYFI